MNTGRSFKTFAGPLLLAAFLPFAALAQDFGFGNYQVVSSSRVGRTLFQYDLAVTITNHSAFASGVTALVASASTNTVVLQNAVGFGDVAQGAAVVSTNTFSILQNRLTPFDPGVLQWTVSATAFAGAISSLQISPVSSPQFVGEPFSVTLTALDNSGNVAGGFNSQVGLSTVVSEYTSTNTLIGDLAPSGSFTGSYSIGYRFTPSTNLTVTHVRSLSGSQVSVWTDAGALVFSQAVNGTEGVWTETPLALPVILTAGTTYRVSAYQGGGNIYYCSSVPPCFADGSIDSSCYVSATNGDQFPANVSSGILYLVDLRYRVGVVESLSSMPSVSGNFTNGVWSGTVTLQSAGAGVSLLADDGNGHSARGNPFSCLYRNDLGVTVFAAPSQSPVGGSLAYSIVVTNTGPNDAHSVLLTNVLSANQLFQSVNVPSLPADLSGNSLVLNLGTIPGGSSLSILLTASCVSPGTAADQVSVGAAEADPNLANNSALASATILNPSVSINNVSLFKGFGGVTNAVFTVSLNYPGSETVSVFYASSNITASSGSDYGYVGGTLSFAPGVTNLTVAVPVYGNLQPKFDQTFAVYLYSPEGVEIGSGTGVCTIRNDTPMPAGFSVVAESCSPTNGAVDPGEQVSLQFSIRNPGPNAISNLVATLLPSEGVLNPSGPQNYGLVPGGSTGAARIFSFTASGPCGGVLLAKLFLQDGTNDLVTATFEIPLGSGISPLTQYFDSVTPGILPEGWTSTNAVGIAPAWTVVGTTNDTPPGAVFCPDPPLSGDNQLCSPVITIRSAAPILSFRHYYSLGDYFHYGSLEVSTNGGEFQDILDAGAVFLAGGYNSPGHWTGDSGGFISTAVSLPASFAGCQAQFRWRLTSYDFYFSEGLGWYVDSIDYDDGNCCGDSNPPVSLAVQDAMTLSIVLSDPRQVLIGVNSAPSGNCVIESSSNLSEWTPVCAEAITNGQNPVFTLPATNGALFYRARVQR